MSSNSETGHAKNVANFETLITRIEVLGTTYNPVKVNLQLAALQAQHTDATAGMKAVSETLPPYRNAVKAREAAFAPLSKLSTRLHNMYKSLVDDPAQAKVVASLAKKIKGGAKTTKPVTSETEEQPKSISTSQRSYDMQMEHFSQLIDVLAANPAYTPNETDLTVATLTAMLADMRRTSKEVSRTESLLDDARSIRNKVLYTDKVGLVDNANGVKAYIKGALTPDHSQYRQILDLEFRKA